MAVSKHTEGFVSVAGGRIWFEIHPAKQGAPLLVVHGGPGLPHDYLRPLRGLSSRQPIVFYDQLGCGRSDRPTGRHLWTLRRFTEELETLIDYLALERYHLFGHSCGAMIALEHALKRPIGLQSAVFASPVFDTKRFVRDINQYRDSLPIDTQDKLTRHENADTLGSPEFVEATRAFYDKHVCRVVPPPTEYLSAAAGMAHDVYSTMWGPTEFICTGTLRSYDRTDRLCDIAIPTLLTCGRWDGVTPETLEYYASLIPASRTAVFEESAHMAPLEEPVIYRTVVQRFLDDVANSRTSKVRTGE